MKNIFLYIFYIGFQNSDIFFLLSELLRIDISRPVLLGKPRLLMKRTIDNPTEMELSEGSWN